MRFLIHVKGKDEHFDPETLEIKHQQSDGEYRPYKNLDPKDHPYVLVPATLWNEFYDLMDTLNVRQDFQNLKGLVLGIRKRDIKQISNSTQIFFEELSPPFDPADHK